MAVTAPGSAALGAQLEALSVLTQWRGLGIFRLINRRIMSENGQLLNHAVQQTVIIYSVQSSQIDSYVLQ